MKKTIRALLLLACLVYVVLFVKDIEAMTTFDLMSGAEHTPEEWTWLFFSEGLTIVSLLLVTVYAFSRYLWKKRWLLAVAVGLYAVFLAFSGMLHVDSSYKALPPVVTLVLMAGYIPCIYAIKLPRRRLIACGVMALQMVGSVTVCLIGAGFSALMPWALRYTAPLILFGLLGLILPDQYD